MGRQGVFRDDPDREINEVAEMTDNRSQAGTAALVEQLELFQLIFDNIPSGAMITTPGGIVTHLNKPYARFLGIDVAKSIGRHCTEVVENTRMHVVGATGVAEINQIQMIRGQNIVAFSARTC